ncbi:MAG TPA: hypothetical protein DEF51_32280 [Myxococcales bacterium]|nr:hypothetical protein [Myxococcales bacterium]
MAVAALVLLGAACSEREDPALVPDVSLYFPDATFLEITPEDLNAHLFIDGRDEGVFTGDVDLHLEPTELLNDKTLLLRVPTACGPFDLPIEVDGGEVGERVARHPDPLVERANVLMALAGPPPAHRPIYADADERVLVGEIRARRAQVMMIGACTPEVRVGDEVVGELPPVSDVDEPAVLIDGTGSRCYQLTTFTYGPGRPGPPPLRLQGAHLHSLPAATDVFQRAPTEQLADPLTGAGARLQLLRVPCG